MLSFLNQRRHSARGCGSDTSSVASLSAFVRYQYAPSRQDLTLEAASWDLRPTLRRCLWASFEVGAAAVTVRCMG